MAELTLARPTAGRRVAAACTALGVFGALPVVLARISSWRLGSPSPLAGLDPPWQWTRPGLDRWWDSLTNGLHTSDQLVDLFVRVGLTVCWLCLAALAAIVVGEMVYVARHGMASGNRRAWFGLGTTGRWIASGLLAVLPMSATRLATASPQIAAHRATPAAVVVQPRFGPVVQRPTDIPAPPAATGPATHVVRRGESVWSIAEQYAPPGQSAAVASLAESILSANLGTVMNDGQRFVTAALIEPGWELTLPSTATAEQPSADHVVVEAGDSYWRIAERHLDRQAGHEVSERAIFDYVPELIEHNAPRLGYDNPAMIHPGDVVEFATPIAAPTPVPPAPSLVPPLFPSIPQPSAPPTPPTTAITTPPTAPATAPATSPATTPDTAPASAVPATVFEPADTVAPFVPPAPSDQPAIPLPVTLAGGTLLATGAALLIAQRRRAALRRAVIGQRLARPAPVSVIVEQRLAELSDVERVARIDLALRAAAGDLADQQAQVRAVVVDDLGRTVLMLDIAATPVARYWLIDPSRNAWILPAEVDLAVLSDEARRSAQPCPALAHFGRASEGEVYVDLEAFGCTAIDDPNVARAVVASVVLSPLGESVEVVQCGLPGLGELGDGLVESVPSAAEAMVRARRHAGHLAELASNATTFRLRARRAAMGSNDPMLVALGGPEADAIDPGELAELAGRGGRGLAVVVTGQMSCAAAWFRPGVSGWRFEPLGIDLEPVVLPADELTCLAAVIADAEPTLVEQHDPVRDTDTAQIDPPLLVRLLGPVAVETADGMPVVFERSKSMELVVWLTQHRTVGSRNSARTALWGSDVRDATFANVVSEARRALAKAVEPPDGDEWIGRSNTEHLPLHSLVATDADVLASAVAAARTEPSVAAIESLRHGLALVRGMPFAGTSYLWPDGEGITSSLTLLATDAAVRMATLALDADRTDDVFWATQQGLLVLPGHEELVALRMRAHAQRGDRAGVRQEWASYERTVRADVWSSGEPSPKLVELRQRLMGGPAITPPTPVG